MDNKLYQKQFESAFTTLRTAPSPNGLLYFTGPVLDSIALKAYKAEWASDPKKPLTSPGRIFFAVWITDKSIEEQKLLYNIHALKLRLFKSHRITSRDFATRFRTLLKSYEKDWPNLDLDHGPLTLMQGWQPLDPQTLEADIVRLVQKFEKIIPLIDTHLRSYKI